MPTEVEVFKLHDQQTWLARLRARRDRAERALNQKLVRKLNRKLAAASVETPKEVADVNEGRDRAERAPNQKLVRKLNRKLAAASMETPKGVADVNEGVQGTAEACLEEVEELEGDMWDLDWTSLSPCRRSASCSDWQVCHHVPH